jgi:hypothetical protein
MTDTGKQQQKPEAAGHHPMAAGRVPRGPAPGSQPAGRNPQAPRAPQGGQQRKPAAGDDDEERVLDIDDEEE